MTDSVGEFFGGNELARQLFAAVLRRVKEIGEVDLRVSKSQIAFRRQRNFAWVWMPGQYLKGKTAPLVLTLSLPTRDSSNRWKEVVEPSAGRFTHHLELYSATEVDDQVSTWLRQAWEFAANRP